MKREPSALVSWDDVAASLEQEPLLTIADHRRFAGKPGDLLLGVAIMLGVSTITGLCTIGAFTVARWLWGVA